MVKLRYKNIIKSILEKHLPKGAKVFVFGSSLRSKNFIDIDVGIKGAKLNEIKLMEAREELDKAPIPYGVDLVDFNAVDKKFKNSVFKDEVLWLI